MTGIFVGMAIFLLGAGATVIALAIVTDLERKYEKKLRALESKRLKTYDEFFKD